MVERCRNVCLSSVLVLVGLITRRRASVDAEASQDHTSNNATSSNGRNKNEGNCQEINENQQKTTGKPSTGSHDDSTPSSSRKSSGGSHTKVQHEDNSLGYDIDLQTFDIEGSSNNNKNSWGTKFRRALSAVNLPRKIRKYQAEKKRFNVHTASEEIREQLKHIYVY